MTVSIYSSGTHQTNSPPKTNEYPLKNVGWEVVFLLEWSLLGCISIFNNFRGGKQKKH